MVNLDFIERRSSLRRSVLFILMSLLYHGAQGRVEMDLDFNGACLSSIFDRTESYCAHKPGRSAGDVIKDELTTSRLNASGSIFEIFQ